MLSRKDLLINNEIYSLMIESSDLFSDYYTFDLYDNRDQWVVECSCQFIPDSQQFVLKTIMTFAGFENKGLASSVMKSVFSKAKELGAFEVNGFISPVDIHTKELQDQAYGFYKKHGAVISGNSFKILLN